MTNPPDGTVRPLLDVCRLLNAEAARYVVAGGYACVMHGIVRNTKDVDIMIPRDIENAERVIRALAGLPLHLADEWAAADLIKRPFTILGDLPRVDILLAAGKLRYDEAWVSRVEAEVDGVRVPYLGIDALIKSKSTDRKRDAADVEELTWIRDRRNRGR